jgi:hypothetical protein
MTRFRRGYVIEPEIFWRPAYRISPFNTSYISKNHTLVQKGIVNKGIVEQFFGASYIPCLSGKQAINFALQQFSLAPADEVWIITTSGNRYISSCVTKEIEKFCKWSMQQSPQTRLIFLNHEFGFCYQQHEQLKRFGLPIIEDRALSFASQDNSQSVGTTGDLVIYSLPKFFPLNFGGILQFNNKALYKPNLQTDAALISMLNCLLSYYLNEVEAIVKKRKENFYYLKELFSQLQFYPRFIPTFYESPGVFMFNAQGINLNGLKEFFQANGVEASVFYGEEAFFIPVHQELSKEDMDFFFLLTFDFIKNGNE